MERRDAAPTRPPNPGPGVPYREDCWSEGETSVLFDAWGDRYIEFNRGNLRQKQWQEVADAVNSRRGAGRRPLRTDVQCKNRIDTLKKKYKVEKSKVADGGESQWPFFSRLDDLIGSALPPSSEKQSMSPPPLAHPMPSHRKGSALPVASAVRPAEPKKKPGVAISAAVDNAFFRRAAAAAAAAAADDDDDDEQEKEDDGSDSLSRSSSRSGRRLKRAREEEGSGVRELAKAIMKFAEIYERVEESKQRQMIELEKQRMEFAKALMFQKVQIIVDSQMHLAKIKRSKRSDTDSYVVDLEDSSRNVLAC
ncbi:trihelix transcription factor ASIL2-like isoform X1 [Zingiber officinale]|uniref:trihelix transcription factor ASIL2-like isoform X1 n=1 Tax=Zingiber officinale TaxID=94328 RepID=UPI001C4C7DAE|nr:trihelix transcription factor ASIL2-like isoform X1 [Zingiber officinale]XP_042387077.1 trihelix transcription factor ASIL2-like isoform X1 [Zingiber officinale]XP_042387078.1 trihelix transcription factor ASIL2-like isoform X1 [Zingiber officinale]